MKETLAQMKQRFKEVTKQAYTPEEMETICLDPKQRERHIYAFDNGFMMAATRLHYGGEDFIRFSFTIMPQHLFRSMQAFNGDADSCGKWALGIVDDFMDGDIGFIRHANAGPAFLIEVKPGARDTISLAT